MMLQICSSSIFCFRTNLARPVKASFLRSAIKAADIASGSKSSSPSGYTIRLSSSRGRGRTKRTSVYRKSPLYPYMAPIDSRISRFHATMLLFFPICSMHSFASLDSGARFGGITYASYKFKYVGIPGFSTGQSYANVPRLVEQREFRSILVI